MARKLDPRTIRARREGADVPPMVKCQSCGKTIADSADRCPHCGEVNTPATLENTGMGVMGCLGIVAGVVVMIGCLGIIAGAILSTVTVMGLSVLSGWSFLLTMACGVAGAYLLARTQAGRFLPRKWK
jgi:ribosomal protein L32